MDFTLPKAFLLFIALLGFYRWNEPKARERDLKYGARCPHYDLNSRRK